MWRHRFSRKNIGPSFLFLIFEVVYFWGLLLWFISGIFHLGYKSCEECRADNVGPPGIKGGDEVVDMDRFEKFVAEEIVKVWQKYTDIDLDDLLFCEIYGACDYKKSLQGNFGGLSNLAKG